MLLFYGVSHEFFLGTLRTNDFVSVSDEALANHRSFAGGAGEAIVVPVTTLKRYEPCTSNACNWFRAGSTSLGEEFTKALCAVWLVLSGSKPLTSQRFLAVRASEALSVPGVIAISDSTLSDDFVALDALGGEFVFVTFCAIDVVFFGDERLGSDRVGANATNKASFVPLTRLVLHLLHACSEDIPATIAPGCKLRVVTRSAIYSVGLGTKLFVD